MIRCTRITADRDRTQLLITGANALTNDHAMRVVPVAEGPAMQLEGRARIARGGARSALREVAHRNLRSVTLSSRIEPARASINIPGMR
jgi:hypothetical protein